MAKHKGMVRRFCMKSIATVLNLDEDTIIEFAKFGENIAFCA